jgi:hypothetical protein
MIHVMEKILRIDKVFFAPAVYTLHKVFFRPASYPVYDP